MLVCLCFLMGWFEVYEMGWFLALVLLHPKPCNRNEDIHQHSIFVHSLVMIFHQHAMPCHSPYANHGAGICTPNICPCPESPRFVGVHIPAPWFAYGFLQWDNDGNREFNHGIWTGHQRGGRIIELRIGLPGRGAVELPGRDHTIPSGNLKGYVLENKCKNNPIIR